MGFAIEVMKAEDIPEVVEVERACFTMPWPASAYKRELKNPKSTRYLVARHYLDNSPPLFKPEIEFHTNNGREKKHGLWHSLLPFFFKDEEGTEYIRNPNPVIGYGGVWLMMDEAHITTLGVSPEYRGKAIGEFLLVGLIDVAMQLGASWLTLEVRVSNTVAQNLYRKYTFKEAGVRRKYYTDNNEDAYIMWSEEITKPAFQEKYAILKKELFERLETEGHLAAKVDSNVPLVKPEDFPSNEETDPPPAPPIIATQPTYEEVQKREQTT
ncbi:MAG: ribosomal protein S18-alanine N-acetyltransferase [Chloroflexota bacterium]|nr:ribosomal protein S18-alanine N-acetyltransferase [Chloroflexota bacterium]